MKELSPHHERIRARGVNAPVYWIARAVLQPLIHVYFRLARFGRGHIPSDGPLIVASNHRSFLDPFVIGCSLGRPIYFMAKRELFENRLQGWFLNALGAFPVSRGESDLEAMTTARAVLRRGDAVVLFPEGTRIRHGSLARPKRGVGRLALETAAPVVPVAVVGSEHARRGWLIRPVRVSVRAGRPLTFPLVEEPSQRLAAEVTARIWPCVELQWEWLGGLPPLRRAAVIGAGSMGRALATLLARAGLEVEVGCRGDARAAVAALRGDGAAPASRSGDPADPAVANGTDAAPGVALGPVRDLELTGVDLIVLAVPASDLPGALAQVSDRVSRRTAVLVVSKGLVGPLGSTPLEYVADRVPARALAWLGGPAHAGEAVEWGASVLVASHDRDLANQLVEALSDAGLTVDCTDDVIGAQLAGCAKNVAALAAAAAAPAGANAAGAAAGRVFSEVQELAFGLGGRSGTFAGLAGAGDLVATVLAPESRNRRAGELLGRGVPAPAAAATLEGTAEALHAAALLAVALDRLGQPAPAAGGLAALVDGRLSPDAWLAALRAAPDGRTRSVA